MYNKLFQKILDSSIWLEDDHVRLVWITFLAAMDQDGFVGLSAPGNVAQRARVSEEDAARALAVLEAPDPKNPGQENEGRRIERIPGTGWMVLNSKKYRDIVKAETARSQTRARVAKHRARKASNALVTAGNEKVTPSEAVAVAVAGGSKKNSSPPAPAPDGFDPFWKKYPRKAGKAAAVKAWGKLDPVARVVALEALGKQLGWPTFADPQYIPHASTWLNGRRWEDEAPNEARPRAEPRTDQDDMREALWGPGA